METGYLQKKIECIDGNNILPTKAKKKDTIKYVELENFTIKAKFEACNTWAACNNATQQVLLSLDT